jgi:hypothetical protein
MRRRWPLCVKGELEVVDDPVRHGIVCDESDDAYLALALGIGDFYRVISSTRLGKNL